MTEIDHENILLFDLDDAPQDIASRIVEFLDKHTTYHMFKKVMKTYSWEAIYKQYLKEMVK